MEEAQSHSGLETMRKAADRLLTLHDQMCASMADMTRGAIEAATEGADPTVIGQEYTRLSPDSVLLPRARRPSLSQLDKLEDEPGAKPVRTTVDLAPGLHRRLKHWAGTAAGELGVPDVPVAEVVRALIRRLDQDRELATTILDDLRARDLTEAWDEAVAEFVDKHENLNEEHRLALTRTTALSLLADTVTIGVASPQDKERIESLWTERLTMLLKRRFPNVHSLRLTVCGDPAGEDGA